MHITDFISSWLLIFSASRLRCSYVGRQKKNSRRYVMSFVNRQCRILFRLPSAFPLIPKILHKLIDLLALKRAVIDIDTSCSSLCSLVSSHLSTLPDKMQKCSFHHCANGYSIILVQNMNNYVGPDLSSVDCRLLCANGWGVFIHFTVDIFVWNECRLWISLITG